MSLLDTSKSFDCDFPIADVADFMNSFDNFSFIECRYEYWELYQSLWIFFSAFIILNFYCFNTWSSFDLDKKDEDFLPWLL